MYFTFANAIIKSTKYSPSLCILVFSNQRYKCWIKNLSVLSFILCCTVRLLLALSDLLQCFPILRDYLFQEITNILNMEDSCLVRYGLNCCSMRHSESHSSSD